MYGHFSKFKILLLLVVFLLSPLKVLADSLTFTAQVGDTILIVKGYTSPNALVVFSEQNNIKGTTSSDTAGYFEKTFTAQDPGLHKMLIYSTDVRNKETIAVEKTIVLLGFQSFEINDLVLPASIDVNNTHYVKDDQIVISGYSRPNSLIEVSIRGKTTKSSLLQSQADGYYIYSAKANEFEFGDYIASASIKDFLNEDSIVSSEISFTITEIPADKVISINPQLEKKCTFFFYNLCFFDTGYKGYLDIVVELRRLILGFVKYYDQPISNIFDINGDGHVSVNDLSIAFYYTKSDNYQVLGVNSEQNGNADLKIQSSKVLGISAASHNVLDFIPNLVNTELVLGIIFFGIFLLLIVVRKVKYGKWRL